MGRDYDAVDERLAGWIARQPLFFVGSAPSGPDGHVNVSPKGPIGTLQVLDAQAERAIIVVAVTRVADSCGYGVPLMRYEGEREHATRWAAKRLRANGPDALLDYQAQKNLRSIDGLPAVELPER